MTWLNEKARPYVEPLARELEAPITLPLDVAFPGSSRRCSSRSGRDGAKLDILVHSIAFAPKEDLQGGLLDCSAEGFAKAMDVSCHSFVRMAKLAAPLMTDGGTMFAMSYYGANRVVPNYNVMGPVKAALEAACRYLAYELGSARHSRACDLARAAQDARGLRPEGLRVDAERGGAEGAGRRAGGHHGCRLRLRLPRHAFRPPDHRGDHLCRRRREHRRVMTPAHRTEHQRISRFSTPDRRASSLRSTTPTQAGLFRGQVEQIGVSPRLPSPTLMAIGSPSRAGLPKARSSRGDAASSGDGRRTDPGQAGAGGRAPGRAWRNRSTPRPCRSTDRYWHGSRELEPLAPLHQPHNLAPIAAIAEAAPHIPQVACFDTAFHRGQPPLAQLFALAAQVH